MALYANVVFPRDADAIYPWSSDTWGHLIKAVYLREQIAEGIWYPDLFPEWYSGEQMLRYFPPLTYYSLVGLNELTGNIFMAGNYLMFMAALIGGHRAQLRVCGGFGHGSAAVQPSVAGFSMDVLAGKASDDRSAVWADDPGTA